MTRSTRLLAALIALALNGGDYAQPDGVSDDPGGDDDDRPPLVSRAFSHERSGVRTPAVLVSSQREVGLISLSMLDRDRPFEPGLASALALCRERGDLKVLVDPGTCDADRVRLACERHGFRFTKSRRGPDGRLVAEFYTDLYYRPGSARHGNNGHDDTYSASAQTRGGSPSPKNSTEMTLGLQQTGQSST